MAEKQNCGSAAAQRVGRISQVAPHSRPAEGVAIGRTDRYGRQIHIGDTLRFDAREWGGDCEFRIELNEGRICHPGAGSDLGQWCEIIRYWDGSEPATQQGAPADPVAPAAGEKLLPDNSELTMDLAIEAFTMLGCDSFTVTADLSAADRNSLSAFGRFQSILLMA